MNDSKKFTINPEVEILNVEGGAVVFEKDMKYICYMDSNASEIISHFSEEITIIQLQKKLEEIYNNINNDELLGFIEECLSAQIIIPSTKDEK